MNIGNSEGAGQWEFAGKFQFRRKRQRIDEEINITSTQEKEPIASQLVTPPIGSLDRSTNLNGSPKKVSWELDVSQSLVPQSETVAVPPSHKSPSPQSMPQNKIKSPMKAGQILPGMDTAMATSNLSNTPNNVPETIALTPIKSLPSFIHSANSHVVQSAQPALGRHRSTTNVREDMEQGNINGGRLRKGRRSEYPRTATAFLDKDDDLPLQRLANHRANAIGQPITLQDKEETVGGGDQLVGQITNTSIGRDDAVEIAQSIQNGKEEAKGGERKKEMVMTVEEREKREREREDIRKAREKFRAERAQKIKEREERRKKRLEAKEIERKQREEERQRKAAERQALQKEANLAALDVLIPSDLPLSEQVKQLLQYAITVARKRHTTSEPFLKGVGKAYEGICCEGLEVPDITDQRTNPENKALRVGKAYEGICCEGLEVPDITDQRTNPENKALRMCARNLGGPIAQFLDKWEASLLARQTEMEQDGEHWQASPEVQLESCKQWLGEDRLAAMTTVEAEKSLVMSIAQIKIAPVVAAMEMDIAVNAVAHTLIPITDKYLACTGPPQ
eukprot:Ihof_evm1s865 gene=Ihof_evmTU1s865